MELKDLLEEEVLDDSTRTRLSIHNKYKKALEKLSEKRFGNNQHQGAIVQEALQHFINELDNDSYTLDENSTQRISGDYSTQLKSGKVIQLEQPDHLGREPYINADPPDTYRKRISLLAAVLRDEQLGFVETDDLNRYIKMGFQKKTERTQQRYVEELIKRADPFEPTDVTPSRVSTPFNTTVETYLPTNGVIVGNTDVFVTFHRTEVEWQLAQIDTELEKTYSLNRKERVSRHLTALDDVLKYLQATGCGDDLCNYIQQETEKRVSRLN